LIAASKRKRAMRTSYATRAVSFAAVTATYLAAAKLGLSLAFLHTSVSPVWPPTGFAIAVLLWLGYRISPAILLGAFLANLATSVPIATAAGIAVGNTLEAVSAVYLLNQFVGGRSPFHRAQDVLKFIAIAGMLSPMLSATIGNASLCLGGAASWHNYGPLWLTWWLGDGSGALVVAPLLLTWIERSQDRWSARRLAEAAVMLLLLVSATSFVFGGFVLSSIGHYPIAHLTIPIVLWAAFRFGARGAAMSIALMSGIAIWGTTRGFGPFAHPDPNEALLLLQAFVVSTTITALILAALVTEHKSARDDLTFLASIVGSTDDAVIGMTLDGAIASWNKAAERIFGYPAKDVIGRQKSLLYPPERAAESSEILDTISTGHAVERYETVRVRRDGTRIDMSLTISPIRDKSDRIVGASIIARDITERKRAEEALRASEDRFRAIVDNSTAFIYLKDLQGRYILMNRRGLRTWGFTLDQVKGKTDHEIYAKDIADAYVQNDRSMLEAGTAIQSEEPGVEPDGLHTYLTVKFPLRGADGEPYAICGVSTDITELKRVDEQREQLLLSEQAARAAAEETNRAKDEFLALASHELRTPLNAIVGWIEILLKSPSDEALYNRAFHVIRRNANIQARIIEDILDVSRIVAGKLQLDSRPLDIAGVIQAAIAAVLPMAEEKHIRLHESIQSGHDPVFGDSQRLQQVLWNLLSNAIKFTPVGGDVEIKLEQVGANAQITVKDTGEGIPQEFLPYIFDRFSQADTSTTRKHGGLGLGLAIVRHLVELHGGAIEAHNASDGLGSTFRVTLPCVVQVFPDTPLQNDTAADGKPRLDGLRVLVVDDDSDSREVLALEISFHGAQTKAAGTVREALELWEQWKPDVLVSDIGMPVEDGYDLIRRVSARAEEYVPAIALTGYTSSEDAARVLAAGYQLHLAKPVDPKQLIEAIAAVGAESVNRRSGGIHAG